MQTIGYRAVAATAYPTSPPHRTPPPLPPAHSVPRVPCEPKSCTGADTRTYAQATTCPMRPVVCKACKNKVVASALSRHEAETCPMRMVECEQGCGEKVPVSGISRHLAKVCHVDYKRTSKSIVALYISAASLVCAYRTLGNACCWAHVELSEGGGTGRLLPVPGVCFVTGKVEALSTNASPLVFPHTPTF